MTKRSIGKGLGAMALLLLAGCAGGPDAAPAQNTGALGAYPVRPGSSGDRTEAPDLGRLPTYNVPRGRCGMILFTRSGAQPVPLFRSLDDGTALMEIEGQELTLDLIGRGGESRVSVPQNQYFEGALASGARVRVAAQTLWGDPFPGGSYVQEGTLTLTGENGWSRVVPVAGIAGCRVPPQG